MRKKTLRIVCLFLAGLMLLTTFGMLFSQLALAANTGDTGDTGGGDTGGGSSPGTVHMIGIKFSGIGEKDKLKAGDTYTAVITVVDKSVYNRNFVYTKSDIDKFNALVTSESDKVRDDYFKNLTSAVYQTGGNFNIVSDATVKYVNNDKSLYATFEISFDVKPDGDGKSLSFSLDYEYLHNTPPVAPATDSSISKKNSYGLFNETIANAPVKSVYIGGGTDDDDSSSSSEDDDDGYRTPTPNIIITEYSYGGTDVMAGTNFSLSLKFENTSKEMDLENIIMQVTPSTDISITSGSNSTFIEKLGAGKSYSKSINMTARNATVAEPQQVTVKFTYEYVLEKARKTGERTEVLAVPVVQLDRFNVGELSVPDQLWGNENAYMSIDYVNKGKTEVANVSARLESDVPGISSSETVGNVKAGDSGTIDFSFTAPASGTISGKIVVTYENSKGEEVSTERPFSATVMDMGNMFPGDDIGAELPTPMPEDTGLSTSAKVMAVIGGLMVAGLTFTIVVKKVKMKREEESDEDI